MDKLYGVTICAVIDPHNLTYPEVNGVALGMKSKANKILIDSAGPIFIAFLAYLKCEYFKASAIHFILKYYFQRLRNLVQAF